MVMLNRRYAVGLLATMIGAAQVPGLVEAALRKPKLAGRLGIQLYMLAEPATRDLTGTLKQVRDIGYREVELAGFHGKTAPQMRAELDKAGLVCPSVHTSFEPFRPGSPALTDVPAVIEIIKAVGATNAVVALYPFLQALMKRPDASTLFADRAKGASAIAEIGRAMTADDWLGFARQLNETGAMLAKAGIRIGYHNHDVEFAKLANGQLAYDLLVASTDPKLVSFELDIGWAASAGQNPIALLKRHHGRITQLHLKDLAAGTAGTNLDMKSVDVGTGVVDWKGLLVALRDSNVEHLYVEQEPPFTSPPIDAARAAFTFLAPRLARAQL